MSDLLARFLDIKEQMFKHKYNAVRTVVDGITFASKGEAALYGVLKLRERAGEVSDLKLQPVYRLDVNGLHIANYRADFSYTDKQTGKFVVADFKGMETDVFRLKQKLMLAIHGITICIVKGRVRNG